MKRLVVLFTTLLLLTVPTLALAKGPVISATEEWSRNLSHVLWLSTSLLF